MTLHLSNVQYLNEKFPCVFYYQILETYLQSHAFHLIQNLSESKFGFDTLYLSKYFFNVNGYWRPSSSMLPFIISTEKIVILNLKLNPNPNFILFLIQNSCFELSRSSFLVAFSLISKDLGSPPSLGLTGLEHFLVELKWFHTNWTILALFENLLAPTFETRPLFPIACLNSPSQFSFFFFFFTCFICNFYF